MERSSWTGLEYSVAGDVSVSVVPDLAKEMEAATSDQTPAAIERSRADDQVASPLRHLIEGDQAALADRGRLSLPPRRSLDPSLVRAEQVLLSVGSGTDFRNPPYDWGWNWGGIRHAVDHTAGTYTTIGAAGNVDDGWPAESNGAAGIAITLRSPGTAATVQIRPFVQYDFQWEMRGNGGSAGGAGALDLSAWRGDQLATPVVYYWLWNDNVSFFQSDGQASGGTAWPLDYRVDLHMEADVDYVVNIGAFVSCRASGIGAGGYGVINASTRWVTVERLWP